MGSAEKAGCVARFFFKTQQASPPEGNRMAPKEIVERVRAIADPLLVNEGMELVEVDYRREARGWVLRLTIDKEGGGALDDVGRVSQQVGRELDVEDFIAAPYVLEVSSPGLNRPLRSEKDFIKHCHRLITLRTVDPINSRQQFKGKLLGVSNNQIGLEMEERQVRY